MGDKVEETPVQKAKREAEEKANAERAAAELKKKQAEEKAAADKKAADEKAAEELKAKAEAEQERLRKEEEEKAKAEAAQNDPAKSEKVYRVRSGFVYLVNGQSKPNLLVISENELDEGQMHKVEAVDARALAEAGAKLMPAQFHGELPSCLAECVTK